ncbi:MAG: CRISPR-associated protein Cas4 [Candidatus Lokiarchaeota archaeon]|nr:CRISPR-associated protein Cas4 [Candidatus Lokiarchaeota archaeon]
MGKKLSSKINYNQLECEDTVFITAEEVSQYFFCKRKPYFRYLYKNPIPQTYLQQMGTDFHKKQVDLRKRRIKSKKRKKKSEIPAVDFEKVYESMGAVDLRIVENDDLGKSNLDLSKPIQTQHSPNEEKYFDLYLYDSRLHLGGIVDYIAFDGNEAWPVDFKTGQKPRDKINDPHKYQLVTLALLIDANFDIFVQKAQIHYLMYKETREFSIKIEDRLRVIKAIREIRESIINEQIPEPTKLNHVCKYCECFNLCRGV